MRIPFWAWWFMSAIALLLVGAMISAAQAQQYGAYRGYAGGLSDRLLEYGRHNYGGYRYSYQAPRQAYRPPVRYNWYGGNSRAYLGGRGGGWGGEW